MQYCVLLITLLLITLSPYYHIFINRSTHYSKLKAQNRKVKVKFLDPNLNLPPPPSPSPLDGEGNGGYYLLFSSIAFSKILIASWEALID